MKSKKSQGHVEIVISFILFISVLIFVFTFINPISKKGKEALLVNEVENKFLDNVSENMGILSAVSVWYDPTPLDSDNDLELCYDFDEADYLEPNDKFVETENYNDGNKKGDRVKFDIYFSDAFADGAAAHKDPGCNSDYYSLGKYSVTNIIVKDRIKELKDKYESDYENLKKELGITEDFDFSFEELDRTRIDELSSSKKTPAGTVIVSKQIPVKIMRTGLNDMVDKKLKEDLRILTLRVW